MTSILSNAPNNPPEFVNVQLGRNWHFTKIEFSLDMEHMGKKHKKFEVKVLIFYEQNDTWKHFFFKLNIYW